MARREALFVAVLRSRLHRLCALTDGPKAELFTRLYTLQKSRYEQEASDLTGDVGGAAGPTRVKGRDKDSAAGAGAAGRTRSHRAAAAGGASDSGARRGRWRDRNDEPLVAGTAMQPGPRASTRTSPRAAAAAARARMAWAAPPATRSGVPALNLPPPGDVLTDAKRYIMVAQSPDALAAATAAGISVSPTTRPNSPRRSGRATKPGVPIAPRHNRSASPPRAPQPPNGRVTRSADRAAAGAQQAMNGGAPARGGLVARERRQPSPPPLPPPPPPPPPPLSTRQLRHHAAPPPPPPPPPRQMRHRVAPVRSVPAPAPGSATGQRRAGKRRADNTAASGGAAAGTVGGGARQTRRGTANLRAQAPPVEQRASPLLTLGTAAASVPRAAKRARRTR